MLSVSIISLRVCLNLFCGFPLLSDISSDLGQNLNLKGQESTMHHKQVLELMLKELMLAASVLSLNLCTNLRS